MTKQRVNMDLNKNLWKRVGIRAIQEGINKKDLVEKALENYLEKEEKEMFKFENLMLVHLNENGTYDLEFQADGKIEFIKNVEAEGADKDEFYFDDEDTVKRIIEEYRED